MFSANENLMLRQHKRRIVDRIEKTMPEEALDMGTTVMVMQVSCKDPGCVPLETAIIIVFPKCGDQQLVPGLPESVGGSYKTKILKPMADVKEDDILDNLPPCFEGGRRTMERVCTYARDVMFAQITQLFGDGSDETESEQNQSDRKAMALYLQACLQDYMSNGCKPPAFGEPFEGIETSTSIPDSDKMTEESQSDNKVTASTAIPSTGNVVIRRKTEEETTKQNYGNGSSSSSSSSTTTTSIRVRQPPRHERAIQQALGGQASIGANNSSAISELFQREHAPGIRKPGCPCCSPDDPSVLADSFLMM